DAVKLPAGRVVRQDGTQPGGGRPRKLAKEAAKARVLLGRFSKEAARLSGNRVVADVLVVLAAQPLAQQEAVCLAFGNGKGAARVEDDLAALKPARQGFLHARSSQPAPASTGPGGCEPTYNLPARFRQPGFAPRTSNESRKHERRQHEKESSFSCCRLSCFRDSYEVFVLANSAILRAGRSP